MDIDLRERYLDTNFLKAQEQFTVQCTAGGIDACIMYFYHKFQIHGRIGQFIHTQIDRRSQENVLMTLIHTHQHFRQLGLQRFEIGLIGDPDNRDGTGSVVRTVQNVAHIGIVDDLDVAAGIFQAGGPDTDAGDFAAETADFNEVADVILILEDREDTGDQIRNQRICTKKLFLCRRQKTLN